MDWKQFVCYFLFLSLEGLAMMKVEAYTDGAHIPSNVTVLAKFPSDFSPRSNTQLEMRTVKKECRGEPNFRKDLSVTFYTLDILTVTILLLTYITSKLTENTVNLTLGPVLLLLGLIYGVPHLIFNFFTRWDPFPRAHAGLLKLGSVMISLYWVLGKITGTQKILDGIGLTFAVTSFTIGGVNIFDGKYERVKELAGRVLGRELVEGYICGYRGAAPAWEGNALQTMF